MTSNTFCGQRLSIWEINRAYARFKHIDKRSQPLYVCLITIDYNAHCLNDIRAVRTQNHIILKGAGAGRIV